MQKGKKMDMAEIPCLSFIEKYLNNYEGPNLVFYIKSLKEAVDEACHAKEMSSRRVLLLYFHNDDDNFSKDFCSCLEQEDVVELLSDSFYILAWDISSADTHETLKEAVKQTFDIDVMKDFISKKKAAVFLITTISSVARVFSFMDGSLKKESLMLTLIQVKEAMEEECSVEQELFNLSQNIIEAEDEICSTKYQQIMFDQLGDRDYDCFEHDEHEHLKSKISFALYGPPQDIKGYEEKEKAAVEGLYNKICLVSNEFSEWDDRIIIAFIYNCTEPLAKEKLSRAKKYPDYNPLTDINPVPIFVLRKCKGVDQPCRVFIDRDSRVYQTWKEYLENNKLPKCKMVVPRNGRYEGDLFGVDVLLEEHFSPACDLSVAVLRGTDIATTTVGLASGGVFLAAMIPAIAVAPIALTVAGVAGAGVGIYSIVRSSFALANRSKHRESMSFANSDARGAYINIVAGSLGFVGAGATTLVSTLSASGVNIGQGARMLVNTINGANIAAGGVGVANSTYEVIYQLIVERQTPSPLTILQLSSSVLFFGNAVYNFRTAGTIIEESQIKTLTDIQDSLQSNRHRKTFNKLLKETMRQTGDSQGRAEVIATIRNMSQRDDVMAVLTRSNKSFNKSGIKFSAGNGDILLNGVPVDIINYGNMQKTSQMQFHLDLPPIPETFTDVDRGRITSNIENAFKVKNLEQILLFGNQLISNKATFEDLASLLLSRFTDYMQKQIIGIAKGFINMLEDEGINLVCAFKKMSPTTEVLYKVLKFIIEFLQKKVDDMEREYQTKKAEAQKRHDFNEREFNAQYTINPNTIKRTLDFFAIALKLFSENPENMMRELLKEFKCWISAKMMEYTRDDIKKEQRAIHQTKEKSKHECEICKGYYYSPL